MRIGSSVLLIAPLLSSAGIINAPAFAQSDKGAYEIMFNGMLDENSPKLKADNSPYMIYNIAAKAGERLVVNANAKGFKPSLNVGIVNNGEPCTDCTNSFNKTDSAIARYIAQKDANIAVRINAMSAYEAGSYNIDIKRFKIKEIMPHNIKIDSIINGEIDNEDAANRDDIAHDLYYIDLNAGQNIRIDLMSDDFDPKLELFLPRPGREGKEFFIRDDDGGIGNNSRIVYKALKSGRYYIDVTPTDAEKIGKYTLEVSSKGIKQHRPPLKSLKNGSELKAIIDPQIDYAEEYGDKFIASDFLFHAEKGKSYWLEAASDDIDIIAAIGHYNGHNIFDPMQTDDDNGGGTNAKIRFYSPKSEDYIIRLRAHEKDFTKLNAGRANVTLKIYNAVQEAAPKTAKPLKIGDNIVVTLQDGGARQGDGTLYDIYAINLKQDDKVTIETTDFNDDKSDTYLAIGSGSADDFKVLDNQEGKIKTEDDDSGVGLNARINFIAPNDGEYLVKVSTTNSAREGKFYLTAKPTPDNSNLPKPININIGTVEGELTTQSPTFTAVEKPFQDYVFDAKSGTSYIIYQRSDNFDAYLYIRPLDDLTADDSDAKFTENDDAKDGIANPTDAAVLYKAVKDGKVLIRASAANNDKYGSFTLEIKPQE